METINIHSVSGPNSLQNLKRTIVKRFILFVAIMAAMFFIPAGTINFWQAWVYLAVLTIPMVFVSIYFLRKDPELIDRRMRTKEKEDKQKNIMRWSTLYFLIAFLTPGFDFRFGWSSVPTELIIIADVVVLLGYLLFFLVLKENSFASRVVEVEKNQKLISTGPYAFVRHPMYSAVLIMYLLTPLALGSYIALTLSLLLIFLIVARIRNEEKVLTKDLEGYNEYKQKVKYRIIPWVW
ncbi:MAG: isoprenylcysteine carboxylmethyltransferase family protein [Bacteroidota bacterium]